MTIKTFKAVTTEKIKNDAPAKIGKVSVGDVVRQGDQYLVALRRLKARDTSLGVIVRFTMRIRP